MRVPDTRSLERRRPQAARSGPQASEVQRVEIEFFRMLNRFVEPMVRAGFGSPRMAPGGFIVLETVGRRSGRAFRSPLAATRIGRHVIVATFRGERSQWVRNLAARPRTRYWAGGRPHESTAFVMHPGKRFREPKSLPAPLRRVARSLAPWTKAGWAFALLSPRGGCEPEG